MATIEKRERKKGILALSRNLSLLFMTICSISCHRNAAPRTAPSMQADTSTGDTSSNASGTDTNDFESKTVAARDTAVSLAFDDVPGPPKPPAPEPVEDYDCYPNDNETPVSCARPLDGWLKPWLSEEELIAKLGPPERKSEKWYQEYDGLFHQSWSYKSKGLSFELNAETEDGPMTMHLIDIFAPSELKTPEGVGVGTPEYFARETYEYRCDPNDSNHGRLVLGTIYFGTMIIFENSKVHKIYIGNIHE